MSIDDGRGSAGIVPLDPTKTPPSDPAFSHCSVRERCYVGEVAESGDMQYGWRLETGPQLTLTGRRYGCKADELAAKLFLVESEWTKTSDTTPWAILPALVVS